MTTRDFIPIQATEPVEGRDDLPLPGADSPGPDRGPAPGDEVDRTPTDPSLRRDQLADRADDRPSGIASEEPDVLPDVEVPDESM